MDTTKLIIEDFDFSRYEITRTYPLGNKTVIQIGESLNSSSKSDLEDKIHDLGVDISGLEKEVKELEEANDDLEEANDDLESKNGKLEDQIDDCFLAITDGFTTFLIDYSASLAENISNLDYHIKKEWLNPDDADEKFAELEIDNRALAHTIERQDLEIQELKRQLSNWEAAYPNG